MRLPWPFGRRTPSDGPSPAAAEGPAPAVPAAPGATAPPTGAWASLPPIQRTVAATPLVAPAAPFLDAVPGHRPLPPIVGHLGHDTGVAGPPGLVVARPVAVPALTSHAPMPVQRRPAGPASPDAADEPWPERSVEAAASPEPAPVRRLAPVPAGATVRPAAAPLTRAPAVVPSTVQRSAGTGTLPAARPAGAPSGTTPGSGPAQAGPAASSTVARPGSGAPAPLPAPRGTAPVRASRWAEASPVASPPAGGLGAPLPSASPAASPPVPAATAGPGVPAAAHGIPAARTASGVSGPAAVQRRVGLGSPMTAVPASAVDRQLPVAGPRARRPHDAAGQRDPGAGVPAAPPSSVAAPAVPDAAAQPARPLPVLPVARLASPATGEASHRNDSGHDHGGPAPAPGPDAVRRTGSTAGPAGQPAPAAAPATTAAAVPGPRATTPAIRPTLGARPLRPRVPVQRDASAGRAADHAPAPVAAHRSPVADLPATIEAIAPVAPAGEAVPLQRLTTPSDPAAPAARAGLHDGPPPMREIVFPPPGVAFPAMAPVATDAFGGATVLQRSAAASGRPVPAGPAARGASAPLSLARPPAAAHGASAPAAGHAGDTAPGPGAAAAPVVQATRAGASGVPDITVRPVVQRIDGSAPPPPAGGQGGATSDKELDELAQALFGRIRTRLRSEVIQEREARGLGFDAF